jgi:X-Pro dipeptidyl-peptidase
MGGTNESLAPKAVIDWLNGRARGFTSATATKRCRRLVDRPGRDDGHLVQRDAAAGRRDHRRPRARGHHPDRAQHVVLPLLPLARPRAITRAATWARTSTSSTTSSTAAPGARGRTATPRSATASWRESDRVTGDYNDFWAGATTSIQLDGVRAAVLMAHAFNDWNVMPEHSVRVIEALKERGCRSRCTSTRAATAARRRSR